MYSNSNVPPVQSKPVEPIVKTCKLLFREHYQYNFPKASDDACAGLLATGSCSEKVPSSQHSLELATSTVQESGLSPPELSETNARNYCEKPVQCAKKTESDIEAAGATLCNDSCSACTRSQSLNLGTSFTGFSIPGKSPLSSSNQRLSLQGTASKDIKKPGGNSLNLPKVLRPTPLQIKKNEVASFYSSKQEDQNRAENIEIVQAKAADIARIYKVNQFPQSIPQNIFLDNYHSISSRRINPIPSKRTILMCSATLCPHCETAEESAGFCENAKSDSEEERKEGDGLRLQE